MSGQNRFGCASPAVFLDRDGTLIEDRGHLRDPSEVVFLPGTISALRRLQRDFLLFIVTNQPGVAEGAVSLRDVARVNDHILDYLGEWGVTVADVYVCRHRRSDGCSCIKPNPYFLLKAADHHGLALCRSYVVGDHPHDVQLACNVGACGVYVLTGHGERHRCELPRDTNVLSGIREAADWILARCALVDGPNELAGRVSEAAGIIRRGGVVAFPTETVYGLGASVHDSQAIARVFEIQKRPRFGPLIVHVRDVDAACEVFEEVPEQALKLAERFWPGPLTLVLRKKRLVPDIVTAGLPTVAVRVPDHPLAVALIREAGVPVAAPSANVFGRVSPTDAHHVEAELGCEVDMILDGGPCRVGVASTIVSLCDAGPALLRPGAVPLEEIERVIGPVARSLVAHSRPQGPGMFSTYYATQTPLRLGPLGESVSAGARVGLLAFRTPFLPGEFEATEVLSRSGDLREAAANLFAAMRRLDSLGLDLIVAEPVPAAGLGRAIMDRLRRASGAPHVRSAVKSEVPTDGH